MNAIAMKSLIMGLRQYYRDADKIETIIMNCALTAAAAAAVGSTVPVLGPAATIISCGGAVWTMYILISRELGIGFDKNLLKALASAVVTNIAMNLGSVIAVEIAACFIPGLGIAAASVMVFGVNYLAGVMFLNLLVKMLERCGSIDNLSKVDVKELKKEMKMDKEDARSIFTQSIKDYTQGKVEEK